MVMIRIDYTRIESKDPAQRWLTPTLANQTHLDIVLEFGLRKAIAIEIFAQVREFAVHPRPYPIDHVSLVQKWGAVTWAV